MDVKIINGIKILEKAMFSSMINGFIQVIIII